MSKLETCSCCNMFLAVTIEKHFNTKVNILNVA